MDQPVFNDIYKSLRKKYLFVYLLASFADWLQGPYLYRLYSSYGYTRNEISLLYVTGFASGTIFGLLIGHFADTFGRKRFCIIYSLTTTISCILTSSSTDYKVLLLARIFGGASTSILYSTFESWYIGQHLSRYKLGSELIGDILTRSTLYNGLLAILAGIFSSVLADNFEFGPLAPFVLAIPVSLLSGYSCMTLWHENLPGSNNDFNFVSSLSRSIDLLLFSKENNRLLFLGASQSLYETVMYHFIFLWTPVLEPIKMRHGLVFGGFMLSVMLGSALNSILATKYRVKRENLLCLSFLLGSFAIFSATLGVYYQEFDASRGEVEGSYVCLVSFLLFEVSVGIYYPAIGYLRGIVVPESHRASIANWFRLPSNIFICLGLLYIGIRVPDNYVIFSACSCALILASITAVNFARIFSLPTKYFPTLNL